MDDSVDIAGAGAVADRGTPPAPDDAIDPCKVRMLRAAVRADLVGARVPVAGFIDTAGVRGSMRALRDAFPAQALHCFAVKANCLQAVLEIARESGLGCEVASAGELHQALGAGIAPERIVFDSPAKTEAEIGFALARGVALNIDNMQEFLRVRTALEARPSDSLIGFRLNPQVGVGSIAAMSTATPTAKFGVALAEQRAELIDAYLAYPWLRAVHAHIGSQGCPFELVAEGLARVVEFALEVNARVGAARIEAINIGGGLPVNFSSDVVKPSFAEYAARLRGAVPELFGGAFRLYTEFGRSLLAKNGVIAARVEYTKRAGGRSIAITHAGAQTAARTVFMPHAWPLRISALDGDGRPKRTPRTRQDIGGPCCFAGDMLADDRPLPLLEPGDLVLVHDTGAYYFSTPFQYNSLPRIAVYGYEADGATVRFTTFRPEERIEELLAATRPPSDGAGAAGPV